ncbi:MAG TPA: M1 family metallopeptidase [Gemmatimonadaceae bacterium]|nr:M1 family metallopeptidase [Gemmatimonadaceae bacterium]
MTNRRASTSARRTVTGCCLLALAAVAAAAPLAAQSTKASSPSPLYVPRNVRQAYAKGTRSPDGRPGAAYWQNRARYTITVETAPPNRRVTGTEQIVYSNNSPDTLRTLVIRLLVNIHKPGAPRLFGASEAYLTSGVHVDAFAVNGESTKWDDSSPYFTWQPVRLAAPLMPHDSVRLAFDWHYDMSVQSGREGAIDSTTFFLAYFYPRVSVYDDYNGWDREDFNDALEFYSDFNDYDVTVKVPANYVVWGTGTLLNAAEVLQPAARQRFEASMVSDTTVHVATRADHAAKGVTRQQPTNAWHFRAANVPDMSFAVSDHYVWDAGSVVVDGATKRRASVQAAYNDSAADYRHMVRYARHALDWLSHSWPGVPYPYEKTTVVQGFAGMEYPMMANDESYADTVFSRFVAEHEIAHTYFPFYMGINETRYGFMDEGWATTFEHLIGRDELGPARAVAFFQQFRVTNWIRNRQPEADLPIVTPFAVGDNGYGKPALGYLALKDMLGDSLFRAALHAYIDRWHGKHPNPWDFFATFDDATGRNLDWFWQRWFFDNSYIDLAVRGVARTKQGYAVALENVGGMPAPVDLTVRYGDGTADTLHQTSAIWKANAKKATVAISTRKAIQSLALQGGIWMDADSTNDRWTAPKKGGVAAASR